MVLLISDLDAIVEQTKKMIHGEEPVKRYFFSKICDIEFEKEESVSLVIVVFDKAKVNNREYQGIITLTYNKSIPVLALVEGGTPQDILEILSLGAWDYLVYPVTDECYADKLESMKRWKWYLNRK